MKPILEQSLGELKEVLKTLEESVLEFPRQNIIMVSGKCEEFSKISFEYWEFKNLILLLDNLQKKCGKQLCPSLLMTHNYFENYQLVLQH
ncbi:hypothetical protein PVL29_004355 [Vitis rotundifolia]|uniref:Uncharacterized protein n=1 Tax=Vitis rotundifolia TaxID=103349 RepID=A0AA39A7U1_VITRO|nr:hypothetical protein PVL29_004355 [Vitis rotundifolia]